MSDFDSPGGFYVKIGVNDEELARRMNRAARSVDQASNGMSQSVDRAERSLSNVTRTMGGVDVAGQAAGKALEATGAGASALFRRADDLGEVLGIVETALLAVSRRSLAFKAALAQTGIELAHTERETTKAARSFGLLESALAAVGVTLTGREFIQRADEARTLAAQIGRTTDNAWEFTRAQRALYDIAQDTGQEISATTALYARLDRATQQLGQSQAVQLELTQTINRAVALSNTTNQAAAGSLFQLGQGFAAGALRGEELNSVLEGTPRLAQAIADGMGVPIGALREMGAEGELTSQRIVTALLATSAVIEEEFGGVAETVSRALTRVDNAFTAFVGRVDEAAGTSAVFARNLDFLVDKFESAAFQDSAVRAMEILTEALTIASGAAMVLIDNIDVLLLSFAAFRAGGAVVGAVLSIQAATTAVRLATAAMGAFSVAATATQRSLIGLGTAFALTNPLGILVSLLTAGAVAYVAFSDGANATSRAVDEQLRVTERLNAAQSANQGILVQLAAAHRDNRAAILEEIDTRRAALEIEIEYARWQAANLQAAVDMPTGTRGRNRARRDALVAALQTAGIERGPFDSITETAEAGISRLNAQVESYLQLQGELAEGVENAGRTFSSTAVDADKLEKAYAAVADQIYELGLETQVATGAMTEIDAAVEQARRELVEAGASGQQLEKVLDDLREAMEANEAVTGDAAMALERLDERMRGLAQETAVLSGVMTENAADAEDLRLALIEAGVGAEEAAERAGELQRALNLRDVADDAKQALEEYDREVTRTVERVADRFEDAFADTVFDSLRGESRDFWDFFEDLAFRAIADISAAFLRANLFQPLAGSVVGAAPSFFGLGQAPAGAAGGGGGGLLGGAGDLLGIGRGLFGGGAGGFMNTPIFSTLPSGFVGPPAAGQVFTIGNALGGLGIGAGVGGLVSGLTGGNSLAGTGIGAGLGLVGTAIGGPVGGIVGGAVGGLLGGLFGPGKSVGPNALAGIDMQDGMFLGLPGAANNGGSAAAAAEAAQGLADALNILVAMTGATPTGWLPGGVFLGDFPSKGGAHVSVGNVRTLAGMEAIYGPASPDPHSGPRGNIAFFLGEQTTAAAVQAALLQTELEGLSEGFETIIASVTRTRMSLEEIEEAFQFGQVYDAVVAAERPVSSFQAAMETLVQSFEDGLRRAADLSLSTEDFAAGTRTTFDRDIEDAILQFTDPLAFAMETYERDARARLEAAIQIGADLAGVERLIGLERAAIIQQAAGASFAGLRESIDRALSGDAVGGLSPLSPRQRLEEAQREFDRLIDLGLAGDAEAAQQATRQRDVLLQMADGVYASSSDFADVFAESGAALESLKGAFDDMTMVGEATSDFIARLLAEIDAAGVAPIVLPTPVPLPEAVTERTPPPRARSIPRRPPFPTGGGEAGPSSSDMRRYREEVEAYYRAIGQTPPTRRPSRQERAMGGPVFGPGGPTDDLIPAWLSNGEFVVRAAAAERIGMENLAMMNATGSMPMAGGDGETAREVRQLRQDLRAVAGGLLEIAEEGVRQGGESARTGQRMLRQLQGINRNLIERG